MKDFLPPPRHACDSTTHFGNSPFSNDYTPGNYSPRLMPGSRAQQPAGGESVTRVGHHRLLLEPPPRRPVMGVMVGGLDCRPVSVSGLRVLF